jgi:hypothetical protein
VWQAKFFELFETAEDPSKSDFALLPHKSHKAWVAAIADGYTFFPRFFPGEPFFPRFFPGKLKLTCTDLLG